MTNAERLAAEAGIPWLSREAQAMRADRADADRADADRDIPPRSDGAQPYTTP